MAFLAMAKPGSVKTRMLLSMICLRAHSGSRSQACSPSSSDSQTSEPPGCHAVERVGVGKGLGIAAENDGDVAQIAVDADAVFGGDHEVAGGRAFLLRAVFGIGADVDDFLGIAVVVFQAVALVEQIVEVADDGAEVFAGGDGAPSADGVEADGDCAFGQQGGRFVADN